MKGKVFAKLRDRKVKNLGVSLRIGLLLDADCGTIILTENVLPVQQPLTIALIDQI